MTLTITKPNINSNPIINQAEVNLLLYCAHTQVNEEIENNIKNLVKQNLDWEYLVTLAYQHGLVPLLFNNLNKICPKAVPQDILSELERYFQAHVKRNLLMTSELINILNLFQNNNIQAISFKGAPLAIYAYNNLALRQFCDLDILVQEHDVSKIVDLLTSIGYELPSPIAEVEDKPYLQYQNFLESTQIQRKYDFIHKQKRVAIDLQWQITEKRLSSFFSLDFTDLLDNSQPISIAGSQVIQFSLEDLLLYLCFHGSKHCWSELKWVCDVAELIQHHPEIDWEKVILKAQNIGCERMLYLGLLLANDLLEIKLPELIIVKINKDKTVQWLGNKCAISIFKQPLKELDKYIFISKLKRNLSVRLSYLVSMLITPTAKEWEYIQLPKSLTFLYFIIRPYRLFLEYISSKNISPI